MKNHELLEELRDAAWFKAAKMAGVKAMTFDEALGNNLLKECSNGYTIATLECDQQLITPSHMLCKGVKGELWPQTEAAFAQKYEDTGEMDGRWHIYRLAHIRPVLATQVPFAFQVRTSWGEVHKGQRGDYLIKAGDDDMWIVDKEIFELTYSKLE